MKQVSDFNENADRFYEVENNGKIIILCDKHTRVMYAATIFPYGDIFLTSMTVLVDTDGQPLLYKGEL